MLEAYLRRIDARMVSFSEDHYSLAAEAFLRYGRGSQSKANLNYGDCLAYAIAAATGHSLLYVGDDFPNTDIPAA